MNTVETDLRLVSIDTTDVIEERDTNFITSIRFWLIKKLAGKTVVVVNARINITGRDEDKLIVGRTAHNGGGFLMHDCWLRSDDEQMLHISNNS